jgi:cytochrome c oxidase subunit 3
MTWQYHPYHIIFPRPWPLIRGGLSIRSLLGIVIWVTRKSARLFLARLRLITLASFLWWRDVSRERSWQGFHSHQVITGLRLGILLFIASEVLFFFSFFWTFFHRSLAPNLEIGRSWPPIGTLPLNPFQVPLLNTVILLSSGIRVTWSHHAILKNNNKTTSIRLLITIILGIYFTLLQAWEYWDASYSFADSIFGSSFFLATGFHGLHVIIGTAFLLISFLRHKINLFSRNHHIGFEISIWYWHFVDVVWLFLYTFLYWWSYFVINISSIFGFQPKSFLKITKLYQKLFPL